MIHEENFYMVTLQDLTCHPISDGVTWFFTKNIEDFQKKWTALEENADRIKKFLQSKAGKLVTDYHKVFDDEEINIVQSDKITIYDEKFFSMENIYFQIKNAIGFKDNLHAEKINLRFKWIRFKKKYLRVAEVEAFGLSNYYCSHGQENFSAAKCIGNPVMEKIGEKNFKSICYLTDKFFKNEQELLTDTKKFIVTKKELDILFNNFTNC